MQINIRNLALTLLLNNSFPNKFVFISSYIKKVNKLQTTYCFRKTLSLNGKIQNTGTFNLIETPNWLPNFIQYILFVNVKKDVHLIKFYCRHGLGGISFQVFKSCLLINRYIRQFYGAFLLSA